MIILKENERQERDNLKERFKQQIESLISSKMENEKHIAVTEQKLSHQIKMYEDIKRSATEQKNKFEQKFKNQTQKFEEIQK